MEHGHDEADALTQSNEADHDRNDDGQETHDFVQNTGKHGIGHDPGEDSSGGLSLKATLLS